MAARPRFSASCTKISRSTTSSRAWASSSGVDRLALARAACCISASTRALGTGLPLTMATFCAAPRRAAARRPTRRRTRARTAWDFDFMGMGCLSAGAQRVGAGAPRRQAPAVRTVGYGAAVRARRARGRRWPARGCPAGISEAQGIIHEAMPRHARQAGEALARDAHAEVPAFARAGVAGVQVAVVLHLERGRLQRSAQRGFDVLAR